VGRLRNVLNSVALVGGAAAVTWNVLLDERAKESVKVAATNVATLSNYFLNSYMEPNSQVSDEQAAAYNRAWVEEQWKQAGY
jgi:hypothetical protein